MGWRTLAAAMEARRSSSVSPAPARASGSAWTRTAGFCRPLSVTSPTPTTCEILCARMESAWSSTAASDRDVDDTASVRIGASAGLLRL